MMITWLLLVSLICKSSQDGDGQGKGVLNCGPRNLTLFTGPNQMILSTWEDDPSCSAVHDVLIYQLEVLIADNRVHNEEVAVTPEQIGSTHSWNWTSYLALECASHSIRLTSIYKNSTIQERALPGTENSNDLKVFPQDRVFKVGSTVTFCCVLPEGEVFRGMYMVGYNHSYMKIGNISNQIHTLTVHLTQPSRTSSTDVVCSAKNNIQNGASNLIGYPPFDRDLKCETRDLESVECQWTVGGETHISFKYPTNYYLSGSPCADGKKGRCSHKVKVDAGEKNWTVKAENVLGMVELSEIVDLTKRVHLLAPKEMIVPTVNARNVTLVWEWPVQRYNNLSITCQVNINQDETQTISGVGLQSAVLNNLIPNSTYKVKVRCGTTQDFWKWSEWSSVNFRTKGDVPDALDVWMKVKDNQTIIIWKVSHMSGNHIKDYEVTWAKTTAKEQANKTKVDHKARHLALSLDATEEYIVTVTARNMNGSSSPSTITIPSLSPESSDRAERVNTTRINGSNSGFNLSWSASPTASCGYIVDWCPALTKYEVEWLKVPPNETSASIRSEQFSDGVQYSVSVYACTQRAPVLLEKKEGYVSEERIKDNLFKLEVKQRNLDLEVSWDPIDLRIQSAFIHGYVLSCLGDSNNIVRNASTDDPKATSLTAKSLKIGSYTCSVKAWTSLGECGTTTISATLNSLTDDLIKPIIISLVTVFVLLSLITVLCYKQWPGIKQKIYPPIPKPVLTDEWLTSLGENNCRPLCVDQHYHSEVDIMDVPVVPCKPGQANGYIGQENLSCSFSQTPAAPGYYNQLPNNCNPPTSTLSTTAIPSKLGIPSSLFRGAFPNLSYELMMQNGDEQCSSPELQGGATLESSSGGYQPQRDVETITVNKTEEEQESSMPCDSTYILLPQPPFK